MYGFLQLSPISRRPWTACWRSTQGKAPRPRMDTGPSRRQLLARPGPRFASPGNGMTLKIATYNVHGCVGTDGKFDLPRVADAIGVLEADVVLLQEVGDPHKRWPAVNQAHDLAEACRMSYAVGYTMPVGPWGYGNAILSRFEI